MSFFEIINISGNTQYTTHMLYCTANNDPEEPYYSTVYTGQPDAIAMKENDAYGCPLPAQQEIFIDENPAYLRVTGQNCTGNTQIND